MKLHETKQHTPMEFSGGDDIVTMAARDPKLRPFVKIMKTYDEQLVLRSVSHHFRMWHKSQIDVLLDYFQVSLFFLLEIYYISLLP